MFYYKFIYTHRCKSYYNVEVDMSLYRNINKRKKAGTSRSKKNSTIDSKTYSDMKNKKGKFADKKKKKKGTLLTRKSY